MKKNLKITFTALLFFLICVLSLTACGNKSDNTKQDITVENGYLVVNGVKTEHKVYVEPTVTIIDGYVAVNGQKTEYAVNTDAVITVDGGYIVVNGVKTDYKIEKTDHSFGDWKLYNESAESCEKKLYYRTCAECSDIEWKEGKYEDHSWNVTTVAATCQSGGYDMRSCSLCPVTEKFNETPVSEHSYSDTYEGNNSQHWRKCTVCGESTAREDHVAELDGFCSSCAMPVSATEGVVYTLSPDGAYAAVAGYNGTSKRVIIADTYEGRPVTTILTDAFNQSEITSVKIPESITTINYDAFGWSYDIKSVYITDLKQWCHISFGDWEANPLNYGAVLYLDGAAVTDLVIPEGTERVGAYAFSNYPHLTSVVIPDSVTLIGEYAFSGSFSNGSKITNVVIGKGVTVIGSYAFQRNTSLTSVTFKGTNMTSIAANAFIECNPALFKEYEYGKYIGDEENPYAVLIAPSIKNLNSYKIHENTVAIADSAFFDCTNLQSINLPKSLKSICAQVFSGCTNLATVNYGGSCEEWNAINKHSRWDYKLTGYKISCTNGTLTK